MSNQKGFTIIELLIATSVVAVILLLTSIMMINIGNLYYKGISQTRVQTDVRNITNEIAEKLKHSGSPAETITGNGMTRLCVFDTVYTFRIGRQLAPNSHVLWKDSIDPGTTCQAPAAGFLDAAVPVTPGKVGAEPGVELIGPRSRLVELSVNTPSPYRIRIGIAVGDNDQLCNPGFAGNSCAAGAPALVPGSAESTSGVLRCKNQASDSYCASASLSTTVVSRR